MKLEIKLERSDKMKVYIAGKITGNPDYIRQFAEAEKLLTEQGHSVINPALKGEGFEYREYIDMGLCQLMKCDAIYLLKGWRESRGACLERAYALTVGMVICDEELEELDHVGSEMG
jgi:hypothetical protein